MPSTDPKSQVCDPAIVNAKSDKPELYLQQIKQKVYPKLKLLAQERDYIREKNDCTKENERVLAAAASISALQEEKEIDPVSHLKTSEDETLIVAPNSANQTNVFLQVSDDRHGENLLLVALNDDGYIRRYADVPYFVELVPAGNIRYPTVNQFIMQLQVNSEREDLPQSEAFWQQRMVRLTILQNILAYCVEHSVTSINNSMCFLPDLSLGCRADKVETTTSLSVIVTHLLAQGFTEKEQTHYSTYLSPEKLEKVPLRTDEQSQSPVLILQQITNALLEQSTALYAEHRKTLIVSLVDRKDTLHRRVSTRARGEQKASILSLTGLGTKVCDLITGGSVTAKKNQLIEIIGGLERGWALTLEDIDYLHTRWGASLSTESGGVSGKYLTALDKALQQLKIPSVYDFDENGQRQGYAVAVP